MFNAKLNLPLPKIPLHLKKQIVNIANDDNVMLYKKSGDGIFECRPLTMELYAWLKINIVEDVSKIVVQTIRDGNFEPHVDGPSTTGLIRYYNLMYIVETGGEKVTTQFYHTTPDMVEIATHSDYRISYSDTHIVESVEFSPDTWNLMYNQNFHSVEGITGKRIGLSISIYTEELPKFLKEIIAT